MSFDILSDGHQIIHSKLEDLDQWMEDGFRARRESFGSELLCYSPTAYPYSIRDHKQRSSLNFISISVTGESCSLNCEHCGGRLLKGMEPLVTPESLVQRCQEIASAGGEGVLISGGSDSRGHVPLRRFAEAIRIVKEDIGLQVVVHTGLVDVQTARILANAGVDAAMLDVIGDERVSREVYHISDGPRQMEQSLEILHSAQVPTVPHILVGLDHGRLCGEVEALDIVSRMSPTAVVIIALSPVRKTSMEDITPPAPIDIGRVITIARLGIPKVPLLLGCARPLGPHKVESDMYAIRSGANGIALISQEGVDFAREKGLKPVFMDVCCSLAYQALS
ncbi:MAG: radical SAM protein [Candidatus Thorarchaeota archaeon]|nr:MAG: radical SAM protein [Candidatus Thorarchaeota archaeon]